MKNRLFVSRAQKKESSARAVAPFLEPAPQRTQHRAYLVFLESLWARFNQEERNAAPMERPVLLLRWLHAAGPD